MAPPKKKTDTEKAKNAISDASQALDRIAARNKAFLERRDKDIFGNDAAWEQAKKGVDDLDDEFSEEEVFQKESLVDFLRGKLREAEVRVMKIGPKGEFIDVTDKVNPKDIRPEDIASIRTEDDGRTFPLGRNRQSKEAAYQVLQRMVPGLRPEATSNKSESIRQMELTLNESDKILEHWKK
jgi:hypothetical protein